MGYFLRYHYISIYLYVYLISNSLSLSMSNLHTHPKCVNHLGLSMSFSYKTLPNIFYPNPQLVFAIYTYLI